MSPGRRGLRHAGGTDITKCCGREAMPPVGDETDDRWVMETDDGCEITESNFPNADLVCPDCGRTWGDDDCEHESVTIDELLEHPDNTDSAWALGTCVDCDEPLHVLLEVGDVRTRGDDE